uniref:Uncharacterized protein n=1 Tax=Cebus imitator TaxID=2715852 RepID=A0A2K5S8C8_CEBIM
MTTTTTFKGVDPNSRNSSRVLRPPGGGSNFSLGFDEPTEQPVRKNKMASNIFGTPEENQAAWAKSAKMWTQTCKAAWGRVKRSPCPLRLCPARWPRPQCHPGEIPLVASPALSWVNSYCPEHCRFVCFLHACELHNLSLTVHLLDLFH